MSTETNTRFVQEMYGKFDSGDIHGLLAAMDESCVWDHRGADLPFNGLFKGREAIGKFFGILRETVEPLSFQRDEYIAQGDKVVVLGSFEWRVTDVDNPGAIWRFDLAEQGAGSRLRFSMVIGQENNGTVPQALKDPAKEERVLNRRRETLKANMQATVEGVKALVDGPT